VVVLLQSRIVQVGWLARDVKAERLSKVLKSHETLLVSGFVVRHHRYWVFPFVARQMSHESGEILQSGVLLVDLVNLIVLLCILLLLVIGDLLVLGRHQRLLRLVVVDLAQGVEQVLDDLLAKAGSGLLVAQQELQAVLTEVAAFEESI